MSDRPKDVRIVYQERRTAPGCPFFDDPTGEGVTYCNHPKSRTIELNGQCLGLDDCDCPMRVAITVLKVAGIEPDKEVLSVISDASCPVCGSRGSMLVGEMLGRKVSSCHKCGVLRIKMYKHLEDGNPVKQR